MKTYQAKKNAIDNVFEIYTLTGCPYPFEGLKNGPIKFPNSQSITANSNTTGAITPGGELSQLCAQFAGNTALLKYFSQK